MARYLARAHPRCNGYVGIVIREPGRNVPLQDVNGRCSGCAYHMAGIVIRGKGQSSASMQKRDQLGRKLPDHDSAATRLIQFAASLCWPACKNITPNAFRTSLVVKLQ